MNSGCKLYGQTRALAETLITDPKATALVHYIHEWTVQRQREWMLNWAKSFPELADWEQRTTFRKFDEKPVLETLPKITIDEWLEMPEIPPEFWLEHDRVNKLRAKLSGLDPETYNPAKEKR